MYTEQTTPINGTPRFAIQDLTLMQLEAMLLMIKYIDLVVIKDSVTPNTIFIKNLGNQLEIMHNLHHKPIQSVVKYNEPVRVPYIIIHPYEL